MIDLPTKAQVYCSDAAAGYCAYVVANPKYQVTHLVVQRNRPPFQEYLVPVDQIKETTDSRIKLRCNLERLEKMKPFEYEDYVRTELPGYLYSPDSSYALPVLGFVPETVRKTTFVPVKRRNIPEGELVLQRGARVEATDGYVGQVDELLLDSNNQEVAYLVLLERHVFQKREITIPVSQIDRFDETTVYLKLDRQSVDALPSAPAQRWTLQEFQQGIPSK